MSLADELLNNLTDEEIAAYTTEDAEQNHIVIGADRFITVPSELKRIAVQHDENVEVVTFDCPRYWKNLDMSKMKIYINYMLPSGKLGCYCANNVVIDELDTNIMHFDWNITSNATPEKGTLSFLVCIKKKDAGGKTKNHWNSELNREMYVSAGLECEEAIIAQYPDIITQILEQIDGEVIIANNPAVDKSLTIEGFAADSKATGRAISVERARIDALQAIPEGSTSADAALYDINIGYDGTDWKAPGAAVRGQAAQLANYIDNKTSQLSNEIGDIYYETVEGSYINVNGNISNFEEYVYFNVDVEDFVGLEIYFKTTLGQSAYYKIVDENGNRLSNSNDTSLSFGEYEFNVKIPSGAKYLMISCYATKINEFSIRLNSISKTISQIIENKNDLPIYETVEGSYINVNGSISSFVDYNYFSYDVENLNGMYVYFKTTLSGWAYYKIVDENGNRLSNSNDTSLSFGEYEFNVKIPSGAKYLMISCMVSGISNYEVKLLDITTSISDLYKLSTNNDSNPLHNIKETPGMIAIFKKYCCIGDSLASGEHEYTKEDGTTGYVDLFPFSWGQCIARATGATCYNLSKGGASTLSWINDFSNQLPDTLSDCYIIALGVNDPLWIELGDISDIDVNDYTNNGDTYYGYYAEIIQRIKEVQPKAKIFCFTQPNSETFSETRSSYNQAVRDIVNIFDNCYLLDFETYAPTYDAAFKAKYFKGDHMNAMGYQWTAYAIMTYIDWIINNNYTDFSNVAFIGTDYE